VTEPEKCFLNLWKRFIRSDSTIADETVPGKCLEFIRKHGTALRGLRQQFLMHLITLWDFSLISSGHMSNCMKEYDQLVCNAKGGNKRECVSLPSAGTALL
jgi:hypothetical protein